MNFQFQSLWKRTTSNCKHSWSASRVRAFLDCSFLPSAALRIKMGWRDHHLDQCWCIPECRLVCRRWTRRHSALQTREWSRHVPTALPLVVKVMLGLRPLHSSVTLHCLQLYIHIYIFTFIFAWAWDQGLGCHVGCSQTLPWGARLWITVSTLWLISELAGINGDGQVTDCSRVPHMIEIHARIPAFTCWMTAWIWLGQVPFTFTVSCNKIKN